MNLLQFFTREEPIAGLEISDAVIRLALLELNKKEQVEIKTLIEEQLPEGAISGAVIKNQLHFTEALKKILKKIEPKIRYVIISLPADNVYSRLFSFPKTIEKEKIEETMKLVVDFQLPVNARDVYLDWEKVDAPRENEALLAALSKKIIDSYLQAFALVGLNVVAIEFHPLSFSRVIDVPPEKSVLIKIPGKEKVGIFIIKNNNLRFSRILPGMFFSDKNSLDAEIEKIKEFYESENKDPISDIIDDNGLKIVKIFEHPKIKKNNGDWLISVGAAFRGLLPRAEDELISLMEVGTEKAYERQKAIVFARLISGVVVGLSLFFAAVFVGAWLLITSIQNNFNKQVSNLQLITSVPPDATELEAKAKKINGLLEKTSSILQSIPQWSNLLEELKSRTVPGIFIANLSLPSPEGMLAINGVAQNRFQLNLFKKSLTESSFFSEVNLPLTNLEQKENISFSMTFRLKNPAALYAR